MKHGPRQLELLAPARDLHTACEAILHGADAVYIGASSHGARSRAANTVDDIRRLVDFAGPYGVKVYVTVNTIVYDNELDQVRRLIWDLYRAGADALIVQDLGILEMDLPPIALHASTQCDTRTAEKARFLADAGFSQIVIARESSVAETAAICEAVDVPVEAFVHGALCVSYSGDCRASFVTTGRSANRGCCAQMCRLPYDLVDGNGNVVARQRHFLSLRDMKRVDNLMELIDAGVTSFKIEGRLKDTSYVKNVTAAYRAALDSIIEANPDMYRRSSRGVSIVSFIPSLDKCFNRGYTDYFLNPRRPGKMASFETPKSVGEPVGTVRTVCGKTLTADLTTVLNNGDGLTYRTPSGKVGGFRVNRVDGRRLYLSEDLHIPEGSELFRNLDRVWEESMSRRTASRLIRVDMVLRMASGRTIVLEGSVDGLDPVVVAADADLQPARNPDNSYRVRTLSKLGDTVFSVGQIEDRLDGFFVQASVIAALRRDLVQALEATLRATRGIDRRRARKDGLRLPQGYKVTYHDNVANSLAERFYRKLGAEEVPYAIEAKTPAKGSEVVVMTTRYCLRRELGVCLKEKTSTHIKGPLRLAGAGFAYRLDFDCAECRMNLIAEINR